MDSWTGKQSSQSSQMNLVAVDSMDCGVKRLEALCPGKWQNLSGEVLRIREKPLGAKDTTKALQSRQL